MSMNKWNAVAANALSLLHKGTSVRETAQLIGISYSTLCKNLAKCSLNNKGEFKAIVRRTEEVRFLFEQVILKQHNLIAPLCDEYKLTPSQLQGILKDFGLTPAWKFEDSTAVNVSNGRRAELWVKSMPEFTVLRDPILKNSKSPYDLVLKGYGAVNVKSTRLIEDKGHSPRYRFTVKGIEKVCKYAVLVGFSADYSRVEVVLMLPYKMVKDISTVSVDKAKLTTGKFKDYVVKIYE